MLRTSFSPWTSHLYSQNSYFLHCRVHSFSWMLHFLLVVGLVECLQWTLQVTVKSLLSSLPSHFRLRLSVENKWHKAPALRWLSSVHELEPHIHKTPACTYVLLVKWRMTPNIMRRLVFFCFLQEYFAWSSRASAGQWLMSQLWRWSEQCCSTFQDKMPYESTNSLTHCIALYLAPFSETFRVFLLFDCCYLYCIKQWQNVVASCVRWNAVL